MNDRFGDYGGQYVPEVLVPALQELEREYVTARADPMFVAELEGYNHHYGGRETPLYFARRLTEKCGGAKIYLKREDLCHGGRPQVQQRDGAGAAGQAHGQDRIIAETGAGQHGTATAMAAAVLGMKAEIYMGAEDVAGSG